MALGWLRDSGEQQSGRLAPDGKCLRGQDVKETAAKDNQWWDYRIRVKGDTIQVYVDGKLVNEFKEEPGRKAGKGFRAPS